nr:hypothetical protein [Bacteroidota bacterium]
MHIVKTSIPGFSDLATSTRRYDQYVPYENRSALGEINIILDGGYSGLS